MLTLHTDLSLTYLSVGDSKRGAPLLLLLHGVGSNERDLLRLEPYFPGFRIISVRAPLLLAPERFAWFQVAFKPDPIHDAAEAEASRQTLITFIDELTERYGVTYQEVVLLGFSQGAILSLSVALSAPERVAGVVAMSGRILQEVRAALTLSPEHRNLPVLVTHGVHDGKLPLHHAQASKAVLESLSVALTYREYPVGHELSEANLQDVGAWLEQRIHAPAFTTRLYPSLLRCGLGALLEFGERRNGRSSFLRTRVEGL